ncbi:MAG TPA: toll/interleukin-1 receptor domain-containing protein [Vicinamibacterales bacterium]|nr:toll/interleukin-1 receptor domain-containing protein [Vicinamibacterales bacterium]
MAQPKVFISYRRSDSLAQTGRLYDRLNRAFPGMFFRDVSEIGIGVDFVAHVERAVGASVALIAVIGPTWATASDERGRRLDIADDFVRVEIRTALARKIRIIPVLVGNAEMVDDDQLPDDLKPLTRWNAIKIVEEYYDQGIEKLVRGLVSELGEPVAGDNAQQADQKIKSLRGEAEAAIGVEDWFGAIQALQAALSLAPNNYEVAARLKWANDQRKLNGLFTEAQELYDRDKKAAALQKFRQVRVAGGDYRGVNQLIAQLESEISSESRRSTVRRWTFGTVATITGVLALLVTLVVWQIRSEFAQDDGGGDSPAVTPGAPAPTPGVNPDERKASPQPVVPQPRPVDPPPAGTAGTGFAPVGQYRAINHENQQMQFQLALNANSTFQVQANAGVYSVPLSAGTFAFDASSGTLVMSGVNNVGGLFSEPMQVYERHEDHFHVMYAGIRWDLFPE